MKLIEYLEVVGQCSGRDLFDEFPELDYRELTGLVNEGKITVTYGNYGSKYYRFSGPEEEVLRVIRNSPDLCTAEDIRKSLNISYQKAMLLLDSMVLLGKIRRCGQRYDITR